MASDIVNAARGWIGAPYRKAGTDKVRGVDCLNFIAQVAREAGLIHTLPAWKNYSYRFWTWPGDPIRDSLREACPPSWFVGASAPPMRGDALGISHMPGCDKILHVVLVSCSSPLLAIHARQGRGVEETRFLPSWRILEVIRPCP